MGKSFGEAGGRGFSSLICVCLAQVNEPMEIPWRFCQGLADQGKGKSDAAVQDAFQQEKECISKNEMANMAQENTKMSEVKQNPHKHHHHYHKTQDGTSTELQRMNQQRGHKNLGS